MNSTTTFDYARFLANVTVQFNRYVPIPLFFLGIIGNVFNLIIFRRRSLRSTPCSACFSATSLANLLVLFDGLIPRVLLSFQTDPADTSTVLCKLKYYVLYASSALSSWYIILASIDRYLTSSTNARMRQLTTLKRTQWLILILTIFALLFFIDVLVCFEANIPNEVLKCNAIRGICRYYHNYSYIVVYSIGPCMLMAIFGILTIKHVRNSGRLVAFQPQTQVASNTGPPLRAIKSRDLQLISMLLVQILFLILFSFPISICRIYLDLTAFSSKTTLRLTQESFALQLVIMLTYIPIIDTFYIYTITGTTFRKECRIIITSWMTKIGIHIRNVADNPSHIVMRTIQ